MHSKSVRKTHSMPEPTPAIVEVDDIRLPSIRADLEQYGNARRLNDMCGECDGQLWSVDHNVVCEQCSTVIGGAHDTPSYQSTPDDFRLPRDTEDRSTHSNSERPRCVGGFPHTYDWVQSDEIDGVVIELDPEEFYQ